MREHTILLVIRATNIVKDGTVKDVYLSLREGIAVLHSFCALESAAAVDFSQLGSTLIYISQEIADRQST